MRRQFPALRSHLPRLSRSILCQPHRVQSAWNTQGSALMPWNRSRASKTRGACPWVLHTASTVPCQAGGAAGAFRELHCTRERLTAPIRVHQGWGGDWLALLCRISSAGRMPRSCLRSPLLLMCSCWEGPGGRGAVVLESLAHTSWLIMSMSQPFGAMVRCVQLGEAGTAATGCMETR